MVIEVTYMSGAGNLFSVIDNRQYNFSVQTLQKLASVLCSENEFNFKYTEGLIAINSGTNNLVFRAEFVNPDGSYGVMCGNGGRCAVGFAYQAGLRSEIDEMIKFSMAGNIYTGIFHSSESVELFFPPPVEIRRNVILDVDNREFIVDFVNVGSEHIIINFEKIEEFEGIDFRKFDINLFARPIRHHDLLIPRGANVNIYKLVDNVVQLRTYERGVEAETGACGTGAISTALIISESHNIAKPMRIIPPSGEELKVDIIKDKKNNTESVILAGNASITDKKEINLPDTLLN